MFNFIKKGKNEVVNDLKSNVTADTNIKKSSVENSLVKILGSGCAKCNELEENTLKALKELEMDTTIEHITDFSEIARYGVMTTPAIVYNGKVLSYGKVLKPDEIISLLKKEIQKNVL